MPGTTPPGLFGSVFYPNIFARDYGLYSYVIHACHATVSACPIGPTARPAIITRKFGGGRITIVGLHRVRPVAVLHTRATSVLISYLGIEEGIRMRTRWCVYILGCVVIGLSS